MLIKLNKVIKRQKNNTNTNININITAKSKNNTKISMNGGKFLGEGSFGCVVSPALSCIKSKSSKTYRKSKISNTSNIYNRNKTVSKIILSPDNSIEDEIDIALKLKKIDPQQKYFITLNNYCKVQQIPSNRSNISSVKYTNNSGNYFQKLEKKPLDKKFCPVDLSMKPINLVMPFGGYDLIEIANVINFYGLTLTANKKLLNNSNNNKLITARMLFKNLKECIKNLLIGLLKMHRNRIVNRDIKEENIMVNYDEKQNKVQLRYIDYGLSEYLTPEFCNHYSNINKNGTHELTSPEIFIIYYLNKYYGNNNYNDDYIMSKINNDIQLYVKKMLKDLKLSTIELSSIVKTLYTEIKMLFQQKKILSKYYGTLEDPLNGYLQKNDIYSLGITLYEFLFIFTDVVNIKSELLLHNLLKKMIELNPENRLNVLQCLNHQYFK
jgi:serine/threonine protein kinase